jgi:hypothetical protein
MEPEPIGTGSKLANLLEIHFAPQWLGSSRTLAVALHPEARSWCPARSMERRRQWTPPFAAFDIKTFQFEIFSRHRHWSPQLVPHMVRTSLDHVPAVLNVLGIAVKEADRHNPPFHKGVKVCETAQLLLQNLQRLDTRAVDFDFDCNGCGCFDSVVLRVDETSVRRG